jgi:voltage-gated potassium channel
VPVSPFYKNRKSSPLNPESRSFLCIARYATPWALGPAASRFQSAHLWVSGARAVSLLELTVLTSRRHLLFDLLRIGTVPRYDTDPSCCRGCKALKGSQMIFSGLTITFIKQFGTGLWLTSPLLLTMAVAITLLGRVVGAREGWTHFDSFYWSFITATTVGYGDIRPLRRSSRVLAILIAFSGLMLTGIIIAVAVHAATLALDATGR